MAVQGAQKNDKTTRASNIGIVILCIVVYISTSFALSFAISDIVNSYLLACILSFSSIGVASFFGIHFILPDEMSRVDTLILHELAKRKLVEFRATEEKVVEQIS